MSTNTTDRTAATTSVIVSGARTPMGRLMGSLKDFSGAELGGIAIKAALVRLFPNFPMADDANWGKVVKRASEGASDALAAVGYNGDANHGRGNHLHLSWRHTPSKRGQPASVVWRLNLRNPKTPKVASLASLASRSNFRLGRKPKQGA